MADFPVLDSSPQSMPLREVQRVKALLEKLHIEPTNPGACSGPDGWIRDPQGEELFSFNPTTGEPIARVLQCSTAGYQSVVEQAQAAFLAWRETPRPPRGR